MAANMPTELREITAQAIMAARIFKTVFPALDFFFIFGGWGGWT